METQSKIKVPSCLAEEENWELFLMGRVFSSGWWKNFGNVWWWLCNTDDVLNITELYTSKWLKWWILSYIYFTIIKIAKIPSLKPLIIVELVKIGYAFNLCHIFSEYFNCIILILTASACGTFIIIIPILKMWNLSLIFS